MNASHPPTDGEAENLQEPEPETINAGSHPAGSSQEQFAAFEGLAAERDQLAAERNELKDLLQRSRAEFENFRRRTEREKHEVAEYGATEVMRAVAGLLDDFDRATAAETTDRVYAKGIELIHQRFAETLKKQGLEPIDSKGRRFDPNLHEAVDRVAADDIDEDIVLDEFQKGFTYKGRLIRPAMVRVGVKN